MRHSRKCDVASCLLPVPKPHCPYFPPCVLFQYLYSNKENQGNLSEERSPMGRESNPGLSWTNRKWSPKQCETGNWYFARSPYISYSTGQRVSSQPSWRDRHLGEYQVVTTRINSITYCFTNILKYFSWTAVGWDSAVGKATRYGLDGPEIESRCGARFSAPVQTSPRVNPVSYTMGTGSFSGVNQPGRGVDHPTQFSAEVKEKVELYIFSPSGSSWPVLGRAWRVPM
jgi:hypothetical protein